MTTKLAQNSNPALLLKHPLYNFCSVNSDFFYIYITLNVNTKHLYIVIIKSNFLIHAYNQDTLIHFCIPNIIIIVIETSPARIHFNSEKEFSFSNFDNVILKNKQQNPDVGATIVRSLFSERKSKVLDCFDPIFLVLLHPKNLNVSFSVFWDRGKNTKLAKTTLNYISKYFISLKKITGKLKSFKIIASCQRSV